MWEISFREMQVVEAIARSKSFSLAANKLGITQSAISHTIANLENRLAITLFTRFKNTVEPTKFALPILKHFETIKQTLADAQREVTGLLVEAPSIRIQTGFRSNTLWLTPAIASLINKNIPLSFDIRVNLKDCRRHLASGTVDLVLSSLDLFPYENEFSKVYLGTYRNEFVVRFRHPLIDRKNLTIEDLKNYPLVGDPIFVQSYNQFFKMSDFWGHYEEKENIFYPAVQLRSLKNIIDILKETEAIGILPNEIVVNELCQNLISTLNISDHIQRENHIYAHYRHSSYTNEFLQVLIDELKSLGHSSKSAPFQSAVSVDKIK